MTQHIMTPHRIRKFERFLHNSPSGHPCPAVSATTAIKKFWRGVPRTPCESATLSKHPIECPEHAENLINRKIRRFYIEMISNFFSQLRKKIRGQKKTFRKKSKKSSTSENCRLSKNRKVRFSKSDIFRFSIRIFFRTLFHRKRIEFFLNSSKKYFFSELKKKLDIISM